MSFDNTQLTEIANFDVKNIVFAKPRVFEKPTEYKRWPIGVKNPDGTLGDLIIETPECYSFGLSEARYKNNPQTGYVFPLCLTDQQNPSEEQLQFIGKFNEIVEYIKKYCVDHRSEIGKNNLTLSKLDDMNPIVQKTDGDGKPIDGSGPVIYTKVWTQPNKDKDGRNISFTIKAPFSTKDGADIDPMTILGKHCKAKAVLKFVEIYVGASISLQIKIVEAQVALKESAPKRFLRKPEYSSTVVMESSSSVEKDDEDKPDEENGSIKGSDDEDDKPSQPEPVVASQPATSSKTPARRTIARNK